MMIYSKLPRNWIQALILSMFAIGLNLLKIDIFFGFQLMLGSSLSVLALLLLGDIGLLVGIGSSLMIWKACGTPWCGLSAMAELLWLSAYLKYFSDKESGHSDGRIIIADILFWLVIGIPAAFLFFGVVNSLDPVKVILLVTKQALNGAIGATFGLSLYLLIRILQTPRDRSKAISIHGVVVAIIMLSAIIPSLIILSTSSSQSIQASQQGEMERLEMIAKQVAVATDFDVPKIADLLHNSGALVEFERINSSALPRRFQSSPGLFKSLSVSHVPDTDGVSKIRGLELLTTKRSTPNLNHLINGYWRLDLAEAYMGEESFLGTAAGRHNVIVVDPARAVIQQLQHQSTRIVDILVWNILVAVLASEVVARFLSKQFDLNNIGNSVGPEGFENSEKMRMQKLNLLPMPSLKSGFIRDLNRIINLLNERSSLVNKLNDDLHSTSLRLKSSRAEIDVLNTVDPLTGCYNQNELYRRLDFELQRSNRDQSDLSFLCLEVDHYNQIRSSYGSAMADLVLIEIVSEIQARARITDCLCRSGEAEFSLVLPMCSEEAAEGLAQKFCHAVETRVVKLEDQQISVTISIGISCLRRGNDDSESLIHRAQNALYRAKVEGRNRSVTA